MTITSLLTIISLSFASVGPEIPAAVPQSAKEQSPRHYCGLYCIYAATNAIGRPMNFDSLVDPRYMTGQFGSTLSDIATALKDNGLGAQQVAFLPIDRLRWIRQPAILHVRSPGSGSTYNHWILFLGFTDGDMVAYMIHRMVQVP